MACWWFLVGAIALYGLAAAVVDIAERLFSRGALAGDEPTVSVVVVARNGEDSIEAFLRGLVLAGANGFCVPHEIVAVDDGSSDATRRVIERLASSYPAMKVVSTADTSRMERGEVVGLSEASGRVVVVCRLGGGVDDAALVEVVRRILKNRRTRRAVPTAASHSCRTMPGAPGGIR